MSSSTESRDVVFFTLRETRMTCCRSVKRFREYHVENRDTPRRAGTTARLTNRRLRDFGEASIVNETTHRSCSPTRISPTPCTVKYPAIRWERHYRRLSVISRGRRSHGANPGSYSQQTMNVRYGPLMASASITRRKLLVVGGSSLAALAGCAGPTSSGEPTITTQPPEENHENDHEPIDHPVKHAEVRMVIDDRGDHFIPHVVWVEIGGAVMWVNESGAHSATAYHPDNQNKPQRVADNARSWDSGLVSEQNAEFTHVRGCRRV